MARKNPKGFENCKGGWVESDEGAKFILEPRSEDRSHVNQIRLEQADLIRKNADPEVTLQRYIRMGIFNPAEAAEIRALL